MKQMDANKQNKHLGQIDKGNLVKRAEDLLFRICSGASHFEYKTAMIGCLFFAEKGEAYREEFIISLELFF